MDVWEEIKHTLYEYERALFGGVSMRIRIERYRKRFMKPRYSKKRILREETIIGEDVIHPPLPDPD